MFVSKHVPKCFRQRLYSFVLVAEGYNIFTACLPAHFYSINDSTAATVVAGASSCGTCPNSSKMTS